MDNFQGDLIDIIRASGASYGSSTSSAEAAPFSHDNNNHHWKFSYALEDPRGNFGDPFSNTRDPFLHELDYMLGSKGLEEACCFGGGVIDTGNSSDLAQEILEDYMRRISPNAKLAMSPCDSQRVLKPSALSSGDMIHANSSKDHCLMDNTGLQISSSRNPGLKRRKSQGKKSICTPAPTAPNGRQSGEIIPSDMWAWRKYGQKSIKGSPHPRGYYRCSSSKGCPARKHVERSRTDPNMLVITYTSEHNHAWPIQRNALAGSTRSNNIANSKTTQPQKGTTTKQLEEEEKEISNSDSNLSPLVAAKNSLSKRTFVKEEINSIKKCNQVEHFFAELREVEADSLNLFFPKCSNTVEDHRESKGLDPFHLFDWSGDNSTKYHLICS